jgi:MFS family permease
VGGTSGAALFFIVAAICALVVRPIFGRWADVRGYVQPVVCCFLCLGTGMAVLGFTYNLPMLVIGAILQGTGYSASFSLFLALAPLKVEPNRRGSAIATAMVGFDLGSGLAAVASGMIAAAVGYTAIFLLGALLAFSAIVVYLLRQRNKP